MSFQGNIRTALLLGSILSAVALTPEAAIAQSAADENDGLTEIIVTAQKREQSVQDVPIAVSALSEDTLKANRVVSVTDLSGLAPGVTVRTAAGGSQLPSFIIRGAVSYGVVPGSDKQVSMYLDGVYLSSPRGTIFELPDTQRIEVLRGPQGTLFGRNATAGAVSITTRDPSGEMGVKADFTVGNYDQYRMRLSVNSPQVGPFSAYVTYLHTQRRGDIRNAGAGQVWDYSKSSSNLGVMRSPKWLGSHNGDSYFAALKFQPSDAFKTVYKFDHFKDTATPDGTGFLGLNTSLPFGALLNSLVTAQSPALFVAADGKRPKVVNNAWAVPTRQRVTGHSLTSTWNANEDLTIKNIFAFRKSYVFAASAIDGFGTVKATSPFLQALGFPAASADALAGQPFGAIVTTPESTSKQYSDEVQINYESKLVTVTAGGVWFHGKDRSGGPLDMQNTFQFTVFPGGIIPLGNKGIALNKQTSIAGYIQTELHVTPQIDIVAGARLTKDKKDGTFTYNIRNGAGVVSADTVVPFSYRKTKPNFLLGVNYKPNNDTLVYGKFSTAFVSGGSVAGIAFKPETAKSWEAGVKASLLDNHLQANLAVYKVTYRYMQTAQGGNTFGSRIDDVVGIKDFYKVIGTFIYPLGGNNPAPATSKGFEFDATAKVAHGLTAGGSLSYSKTKFSYVDPVLVSSNFGDYQPTLRPKWTGGLWAAYETAPIAGDATLMLRVDGTWRSKVLMYANQNPASSATAATVFAAYPGLTTSPSAWIVNARAAIRNIDIGGVKAEIAIWSKNLTNDKSRTFQLINAGFDGSANYQSARTIGADLNIQF